jgi:G3E family GTPase
VGLVGIYFGCREMTIPVTVITGFLGAGKTTLILSLLPQLEGLRIVLLKNEFGDVAGQHSKIGRIPLSIPHE